MSSLEFGRFGVEGLGRLVREARPVKEIIRDSMKISDELAHKLYLKAKTLVYQTDSDIFTKVDKFGRTIKTNKAGYKEIIDKNGELVYLRRPDKYNFLDKDPDLGYPVLKYKINRPKSKVSDYGIMKAKVTEKGVAPSRLDTQSADGTFKWNYFDHDEKFLDDKVAKMVDTSAVKGLNPIAKPADIDVKPIPCPQVGAPQLQKPVLSDEVIHKKYNPRTGIWEEVAQKGQEYFEKCKKDFLG